MKTIKEDYQAIELALYHKEVTTPSLKPQQKNAQKKTVRFIDEKANSDQDNGSGIRIFNTETHYKAKKDPFPFSARHQPSLRKELFKDLDEHKRVSNGTSDNTVPEEHIQRHYAKTPSKWIQYRFSPVIPYGSEANISLPSKKHKNKEIEPNPNKIYKMKE